MTKKTEVIHRPVIETVINSIAIAFTSFGIINITAGGWRGYPAITFGIILEFVKYYGRKRNLW